MEEKRNKVLLQKTIIIALIVVAISFVVLAFYGHTIITKFWLPNFKANEETGQLGDTIGGIMNPFISLAIGSVTFLAFYMQFLANKGLEKQLFEQQKQFKVSQFESQFYEMLKLHKTNAKEFSIKKALSSESLLVGNNVFKKILFEMHEAYKITSEYYPNLTPKEKINLLYEVTFNGIDFYYKNKTQYEQLEQNFYTSLYSLRSKAEIENRCFYFDLSSEFSRYYRHLYQIVKYIAKQDEKYVNYSEKRNYIRLLRAQLTNEEQVLLFYNWFSGYGKEWEEINYKNKEKNHFFTDYRMIHNINQSMLIDEIKLTSIFSLKEKYRTEPLRKKDPLFEYLDNMYQLA